MIGYWNFTLIIRYYFVLDYSYSTIHNQPILHKAQLIPYNQNQYVKTNNSGHHMLAHSSKHHIRWLAYPTSCLLSCHVQGIYTADNVASYQ
jgi:hypothetical protein